MIVRSLVSVCVLISSTRRHTSTIHDFVAIAALNLGRRLRAVAIAAITIITITSVVMVCTCGALGRESCQACSHSKLQIAIESLLLVQLLGPLLLLLCSV